MSSVESSKRFASGLKVFVYLFLLFFLLRKVGESEANVLEILTSETQTHAHTFA